MSKAVVEKRLDEPVGTATLRARKRANDWRAVKLEKGLCPKHGMPLTSLTHCYVCRPGSSLRSLKTGDRLKKCFRCVGCGRCFHEGSIYHHISARKLCGIKPGPQNSLFNFDERKPGDPQKVLSLCGECRKEGRGVWRYRSFSGWSGLCDLHADQARRLSQDEHIGEQGRGITIFWSKADMNEVPAEYNECGCKILMPRSTAINYRNVPPITGRCIDHQPTPPHKKDEDKYIGEEGRGVWLRFSQEDEQGRVLIEYEVCGSACSRYAPRQTALAYLHACEVQGRRIRGMCAEHVKNPAALLERQKVELASGNGQKNVGAEKRSVGAPKGTNAVITEETLKAAFRQLGSHAIQERVAELIGVTDRGVRGWQKARGLTWRRVQELYS